MAMDKNNKIYMTKVLTSLLVILLVWTSISLYHYYTGPKAKIDTYMTYLAKKEYDKIYNMLDKEPVLNLYTKEQIIAYYTRIYDIENNLVEIARKSDVVVKDNGLYEKNRSAFCNINYVYANKEQIGTLYLVNRENEWKIQFPFTLSEVKIYAPMGSKVYMNNKKIDIYENEVYIQRDVLPGRYMVQVEFPNKIYNTYNKTIDVPSEKEVILPYNTLNVEVRTIENMMVELEGIQKNSTQGVAVFNNILEGNYKLKVRSSNECINPVEMNVEINKNTRLLNVLDITLSEIGKQKLNQFIKDFYKSYLKDIKEQTCSHMMPYINKNTNTDFVNDFKQWFIDNKKIKDAKIVVRPNAIQIDETGLLQTNLLETIELVNKEFDKYENQYVNRKYKIILEWDTKIDMSGDEWLIIGRKIKQSIVSYEDTEGKWIQY